jgi:hypothetical protein
METILDSDLDEKSFSANKYLDVWMAGVGLYCLVFISFLPGLKSLAINFLSEERFEQIEFLTLSVSILYLPFLIGYAINFLSLVISKAFRKGKNERKTALIASRLFSLIANSLLITKILVGGMPSYNHYFIDSKPLEILKSLFLGVNFFGLIIFSAVSLWLFALLSSWANGKKEILEKLLKVLLLMSLIVIAIFSWRIFYDDGSIFHLNVVLFPLITVLNSSHTFPMASDDFVALYGGYFLLIQIPLKVLGSNLLSVQIILCFSVVIQSLMYKKQASCIHSFCLIDILELLLFPHNDT